MIKIIFLSVLPVFVVVINSCSVAKFTTRLNDIDSVIRIVNPDHNCGCDYKNKTVSLLMTNDGKRNTYFWQTVYVKNESAGGVPAMAPKIRSELIKLMPELGNYRRVYLEFRENQTTAKDTIFKSIIIGTSYFLKNKCDGYIPAITAKELIKKSHTKKYEAALCNK